MNDTVSARLRCFSVVATVLSTGAWFAGASHAAPLAPAHPDYAWLLDEGAGTSLSEMHMRASGDLQGPGGQVPAWSTSTPFAYAGNYSLEYTPSQSAEGNRAVLDGHYSGEKGTVAFWAADNTGSTPAYVMDSSNGARTLLYRGVAGLGFYLNNRSIATLDDSLIPVDGATDQWTHVAVVWDNSLTSDRIKVYQNGAATPFFTSNATVSAVNPAYNYLGSRMSGNEAWGGKIDEYALWNRALSLDEVQWLSQNSLHALDPIQSPPVPVSAWQFDEGTGATAHDRFGGNDGTLSDAAAWTDNVPLDSYAGNNALAFDGGDHVEFGPHQYGTEGSISLWAYRDFGSAGSRYLFDSSDGSRTLLYHTGSEYSLYMNQTSLGTIDDNLAPEGEWTHLTITWDNDAATDKQKIYKNGELFTTFDRTLTARTPSALFLGSRYTQNEKWIGMLDDYALWSTALAPEQVRWLYSNSLHAIPEPGSLTLLLLGAFGLFVRPRRRRAA